MFSVLRAASLGRLKTTLFQFTDEKGASHSLQVKLTRVDMPVTSVPSFLLSLCDVELVAPEECSLRTSCVTVQLWKHSESCDLCDISRQGVEPGSLTLILAFECRQAGFCTHSGAYKVL